MKNWTEELSPCSHCGRDLKFRWSKNNTLQFFFESSLGIEKSWLTLRKTARTVSCNECGMTDKIPKKVLLFCYGTTE